MLAEKGTDTLAASSTTALINSGITIQGNASSAYSLKDPKYDLFASCFGNSIWKTPGELFI